MCCFLEGSIEHIRCGHFVQFYDLISMVYFILLPLPMVSWQKYVRRLFLEKKKEILKKKYSVFLLKRVTLNTFCFSFRKITYSKTIFITLSQMLSRRPQVIFATSTMLASCLALFWRWISRICTKKKKKKKREAEHITENQGIQTQDQWI